MEPTVDQMSISVSDGLHRSAPIPFYIIISPTNDETPSLLLVNFTVRQFQKPFSTQLSEDFCWCSEHKVVLHFLQVREGAIRELTPSILDGFDLDAPEDVLTFTVVQPPAHGSLIHDIYGTETSRFKEMGEELLRRSLSIASFTLQELRQGESEPAVHCIKSSAWKSALVMCPTRCFHFFDQETTTM